MVTRFELLLELKTRPDGKPVSFKQDGQRFAKSTTVKLCVDQTYTLNLLFRPAHKLMIWSVEDECLSFTELAESTKKMDKDMAAYTAVWSTKGCRVTKDGHRHELRLHFQLENDLVLNTSMQVKFYSSERHTASMWGQPMHVLDLSCDALPGQNYVRVRRGSIL